MYRYILLFLLVFLISCDSNPDPSEFTFSIQKNFNLTHYNEYGYNAPRPCRRTDYSLDGRTGVRAIDISIIRIGTLQETIHDERFTSYWPVRARIKGECSYSGDHRFFIDDSVSPPDTLQIFREEFEITKEYKLAKNEFDEWIAYEYD